MKLYIANCSQQTQEVNYRVPESTKVHTQTIPAGGQALIGNDQFSEIQVDAVIAQQRRYGLLAVGEIGSKVPDQIPLAFSTGNPVTADTIRRVINHNRGVLRIQGHELRKQAAIAVHNQIADAVDGNVNATEMSVEEISSGTMPHDDDDGPMAEGIRVSDEARQAAAKPKRGGRNKK